MANLFPADGNAGAGTANPTFGLLQVQLSQQQATMDRQGLALTVAGNDNPAMLYPRLNKGGGGDYNWYLTRNQQDDLGMLLDPDGNVEFAQDVSIAKNATIQANASMATVSVLQDAAVGGTLSARNVDVVQNLNAATAAISGNATIAAATVTGNAAAASLTVNGDAAIGGTATILTAAVTANATVGGNAAITGNLAVTGTATISGDLSITAGALKIKQWQIAVPDYVFGHGYRLPELQEVASFVRARGHLPEMPSAAEFRAEGLDAAQMVFMLLKKIEELTLYLLQHDERLVALSQRFPHVESAPEPTAAGAPLPAAVGYESRGGRRRL
jgi:hypothetical protein